GAALAAARSAGLFARVRARAYWAWPALAGFAAATAVHAGAAAYAFVLPAVAVIGVLLVVVAVEQGSRLLARRPVVGTGSLSYGLYVWQATIFLFFGAGIVGALAAVAAGWASTRWIERRFRRRATARMRTARAKIGMHQRRPPEAVVPG